MIPQKSYRELGSLEPYRNKPDGLRDDQQIIIQDGLLQSVIRLLIQVPEESSSLDPET